MCSYCERARGNSDRSGSSIGSRTKAKCEHLAVEIAAAASTAGDAFVDAAAAQGRNSIKDLCSLFGRPFLWLALVVDMAAWGKANAKTEKIQS